MKKLSCILCVLICVNCETTSVKSIPPNLGGWDFVWMQKVKKGLRNGEQQYLEAFNQLIDDAEKAMEEGVFSVTFKKIVPPSGSKHDYMSMGPYWWPDPEKPDGLPYIRRDGEVNPERHELDSFQKNKLIDNVRSLSLAWFFTDEVRYADKAVELLKVWFLDEKTRMNPHLEYAQAIPGKTPGRFIGVIDAASFHILVDAISLLEISNRLEPKEIGALHDWFNRYMRWLTESDHGKNEDAYKNNHSVAYDVQSSGVAFFIRDYEFVARKARELPRRRIDPMIEADGSQPEELIRTKAFSYSVGNLGNFIKVGEKGLKVGVNIFKYKNVKGGSIRQALDFLLQYVGKQQDWPYQQISGWEEAEDKLGLILRRASVIYDSDEYEKIWFEVFDERLKKDWSLLVIPGCE